MTEYDEKFNRVKTTLWESKAKITNILIEVEKLEKELSGYYKRFIKDSKNFRIASFVYNHATKDYKQVITVYIDSKDKDGVPDSIRYDLDALKTLVYLQTSSNKVHIKDVIEHCAI